MKQVALIIILLTIITGSKNSIFGQSTPLFSEYNYNPFIINPAYTGFHEHTDIFLSNNGLMNDFHGSPKNITFTVNSPIASKNIGIGAGFINDRVGVTSVNHISYKIDVDMEGERPNYEIVSPYFISFGLRAGVKFYQENLLELGIMDDPEFDHNLRSKIPTVGAGFVLNKNHFFVGLSTSNLLGNLLANGDEIKTKNPYYGYFGYRFYTNDFREVLVKPSLLFKYEQGAPFQVDINTSVSYKNKVEFGMGYRTTSALNVTIGFYALKHMRLLYSYNQPFNNLPIKNTHGLSLHFRFGNGFTD